MRGFNRAIIAGNLARDPDVRYTVNKRAYARFAVAVNYRYKDSNGEYKDSVDYINVVVWGPMAENCGKYLKKGSAVLLEGRIQSSSYEARDGSGKKYYTEVNAENVQFLGGGQQGNNQQNSGGNFSRGSNPDFSGMPDYLPSDDDFGKSIGESGFGNFSSGGFGNSLAQSPNLTDESDIPF